MNTNTLSQIKDKLEEMEKRIKSLSMQIKTNDELQTIKMVLQQLKEILDEYQINIESFETEYDEKIENLQIEINNLSSTLTLKIQEIEQMDLTIQGLEFDFAELQAEALSTKSKATQSAIDIISINEDILDIAQGIQVIQSSLSELLTFKTQTQNSISTINTDIENIETSIEEIEENVETNTNSISTLITRVNTIENSGGGSGGSTGLVSDETIGSDYVETTHFYQELNLDVYDGNINPTVSTLLYFHCEPTSPVTIEITYSISTDETSSLHGAKLYLNQEVVHFEWLHSVQNRDVHITHTFFPTERVNYLVYHQSSNKLLNASQLNVKLTGRNITVYKRESDYAISLFNGKYYVFDKRDTGKVGVVEKDDYTLDYELPRVIDATEYNLYKVNDVVVYPLLLDGESEYGYKENYDNNLAIIGDCFDELEEVRTGRLVFYNENLESYQGMQINGIEFIISTYQPYRLIDGDFMSGVITLDKDFKIIFINIDGNRIMPTYLKYKSQYVQDRVIAIANVFGKQTGFDNPDELYHGCIVAHSDGWWYFYPKVENQYRIKLCKGINGRAYYQEDGTITVYIGYLCHMKKFVLNYDIVNDKYSLNSDVKQYNFVTNMFELYDDKYLIKKNGEYQIVEEDEL